MSTKQDYYVTLGLAKNASDDEIKKAYRKLSMKYHPDRLASESQEAQAAGEAKFKEAKEAYEQLSDPQRRAAYDQYGHDAPQHHFQSHGGAMPQDMEDVLRTMFGGGNPFGDIFGQQRQQAPRKVINITLEQAYTGFQFTDQNVQFQIQAGTRHGTKYFHDGIIYQIGVYAHPKFKRANDDLLLEIEINAFEAMLGIDASLEHLDKAQLQFAIPAGIQTGQIVRLSGRGMRNPENDRVGDLHVRVSVATPKSLTNEQIEVLKTMPRRVSFNI